MLLRDNALTPICEFLLFGFKSSNDLKPKSQNSPGEKTKQLNAIFPRFQWNPRFVLRVPLLHHSVLQLLCFISNPLIFPLA